MHTLVTPAGEFSTIFPSYLVVTRIFLVPLIVMARKFLEFLLPSAIANCFRRADFAHHQHILKR